MSSEEKKPTLLAKRLVSCVLTLFAALTPAAADYRFAVEDVELGQIIRRGSASEFGVPPGSLILAPQRNYRYWLLETGLGLVDSADFTTPRSGQSFTIPDVFLDFGDETDSDGDGLADDAERILGTDPLLADTDQDGLSDGAEIAQGLDPLDGQPSLPGLRWSVDTPGTAVDVCVNGTTAAIADSASGVAVFEVAADGGPIRVAQVATPGSAQRVACGFDRVAAADGTRELLILDTSDPPAASIRHRIALLGEVRAVSTDGVRVFAGTETGIVASVDLETGLVLDQISVSGPIRDLGLGGDFLYLLTDTDVHAVALDVGLELAGSAPSPSVAGPNVRLFVGGDLAYAVHGKGYNTYDLGDALQPQLIAAGETGQFGWQDLAANGSGLAVAAVGPNSTFDGSHDLWLYDVSDPNDTDAFIGAIPTPGDARAVVVDGGRAFVADHHHGLQVIDYLAADTHGEAPAISLAASFPLDPAEVEEGRLVRVSASVHDDEQVREVVFFIDGVPLEDASFPFERRFMTPLLAERSAFTLQARATDTGGNVAWTEPIVVQLSADTTPPEVFQVSPQDVAGADSLALLALFSEPIDSSTVTAETFLLFSAGEDGEIGTADDLPVGDGEVAYRPALEAAEMHFSSPLPDGAYRAVLTDAVADVAGNRLDTDVTWSFLVVDAVRWIDAGGGDWHDASNWSTGSVPGPEDTVLIDVPGQHTITHTQGLSQVRGLVSRNDLVLSGGVLDVETTVLMTGQLRLSGGTLRSGEVTSDQPVIVTGLTQSRLESVTLECDLLFAGPTTLRISGGLTLNATMDLGVVPSDLIFDGGEPQLVDGTGEIVSTVPHFPGHDMILTENTSLTLGPALTFRGGRIVARGAGQAHTVETLSNLGTMLADQPGWAISIAFDQFSNQGVAAAAGGVLDLQASWSNSGTLRSEAGDLALGGTFTTEDLGSLENAGGTTSVTGVFENTGQVLGLDEVTGNLDLRGGTLRGGAVQATGGAGLRVAASSVSRMEGVVLDTDVAFVGRTTLRISGGLTLNGTMDVGAAPSDLIFDGGEPQLVDGTGQIVFTVPYFPGHDMILTENTSLTLGPGLTLRGGRVLVRGAGQADTVETLSNLGTILADQPGWAISIALDHFSNQGVAATAGGVLDLQASWSNSGTLRSEAGDLALGGTFTTGDLGSLENAGGTTSVIGVFENTGQILGLDEATGNLDLRGGTLRGGTVQATGGAGLRVAASSVSRMEGVVLDTDVTFVGQATLRISGGLTLNGTLDVGAAPSDLIFDGGEPQLVDGTGEIVFTVPYFPGHDMILTENTSLTLGPELTFRGGRVLARGAGQAHTVETLSNLGTMLADQPGWAISIALDHFSNQGVAAAAGGVLDLQASWSNSGTLRSEGGDLVLGGTFTTGDLGSLENAGGTTSVIGVFENTGQILGLDETTGDLDLRGGTLRGGTVRATGGAGLRVAASSVSRMEGVVLDTDVTFFGQTTLRVSGGLTLNGTLDVGAAPSDLIFDGGEPQLVDGTGEIVFTVPYFPGHDMILTENTSLTLGPELTFRGGRVLVRGAGQADSVETLSNLGTILADQPGWPLSIALDRFDNQGTLSRISGAPMTVGTEVENRGSLRPGLGALHVDGALIQDPSGRLVVDIQGSTSGDFSTLDVSGEASLDGTLDIVLAEGYVPDLGETFDVLRYAAHVGTFSQVLGAELGHGRQLELHFDGDRLQLVVVPSL